MPATVPDDIAKALAAGGPAPAGLSADEKRAYDQIDTFYKHGLGYAQGMTSYLYARQIRIFDYVRFAQPLRDAVCQNAERLAAENGLTIEFLRRPKSVRKEDKVQQILRQQLVIEKAVGPSVHVSDSDVKAYFDKNHATLDKPEQVRARHILVADEKTADAFSHHPRERRAERRSHLAALRSRRCSPRARARLEGKDPLRDRRALGAPLRDRYRAGLRRRDRRGRS